MASSTSRRLASLFFRNRSHLSINQGTRSFYQSSMLTRTIQTLTEPLQMTNDDGNDSSNDPSNDPNLHSSSNTNITFSASSNMKTSTRHDLAMVFTCKVCETRSVKTTSRESYEKGIVLARCEGCSNIHLIADRLGWFGEPGSVEDFLKARGEEVLKGSSDTINLTLEDLVGANVSKQD